jgi:LuxR family transcriptional regulator, maltose regulon positive regulatory protein
VLRLLIAGRSGPEIAAALVVAPSTVKTHLKRIYEKLDVHSRDQAIARARELKIR